MTRHRDGNDCALSTPDRIGGEEQAQSRQAKNKSAVLSVKEYRADDRCWYGNRPAS